MYPKAKVNKVHTKWTITPQNEHDSTCPHCKQKIPSHSIIIQLKTPHDFTIYEAELMEKQLLKSPMWEVSHREYAKCPAGKFFFDNIEKIEMI